MFIDINFVSDRQWKWTSDSISVMKWKISERIKKQKNNLKFLLGDSEKRASEKIKRERPALVLTNRREFELTWDFVEKERFTQRKWERQLPSDTSEQSSR